MTTLNNGDCRIRHREYITDIETTGAPSPFAVASLPINPGLAASFPWLSRIAANYESYKFESLSFSYETEAPTSLGGSLMLAVDYDATDPAPINKQQAMAYRSSVRSAPWNRCKFNAAAEDLGKFKTNYVRTGPNPQDTDIKLYDIGNLFIITQGISVDPSVIGELYVEYTVRLMTPSINTPPGPLGGIVSGGGSLTAAMPLGDNPVLADGTLGVNLTDSKTASEVYFQYAGSYWLTFNVAGTSLTDTTVTSDAKSTTIYNYVVVKNSTSTQFLHHYRVVLDKPCTLTIVATGSSAITTCHLYIGLCPTLT